MDLELAETAADTSLSRRRLVTAAGATGLAGLAAAFVMDRNALVAASAPDEATRRPTDADMALLAQVIGLELAASDLYRAAGENASEDLAVAIGVMGDNHRAYAEAIAGITGMSARGRNDDVYDANIDGFTGSNDDFFLTAHTLEQVAVATHSDLMQQYESLHAIELTASIAVVEARHATVLADLLGIDDLDVLFGNEESPLELTGEDA